MKSISCLSAVAVLYFTVAVSATLLDTLKTIHSSPAFHNLNHTEQVVIVELLLEAGSGELQAYIDYIGFQHVLAVIDALPQKEAHDLNHYLIMELERENQSNTDPIVGRRSVMDLLDILESMESTDVYLTQQQQKQLAKDLLSATENNRLEQLTKGVGYSTILRLVDELLTISAGHHGTNENHSE